MYADIGAMNLNVKKILRSVTIKKNTHSNVSIKNGQRLWTKISQKKKYEYK